MENHRKLVAVVSDLMFTVKIQDAAKRAGFEAVFVQSEQDALAQARQDPAVMILDLNNAAIDPLALVSKLKSDEATKAIRLLGYVSHVQTDLKRTAQEKGCDRVIARSVLSQNLPAILIDLTLGNQR